MEENGIIEIAHTCPNCKQVNIAAVNIELYNRWQAGEHVQTVFPDMTPAEREFLITGICSDNCWEEYLGSPED